jgi:Tfp pilus assembly pilus retraction ATPase PilT
MIDDGLEILKADDTLEFAQSIINNIQYSKLAKGKNLDFSFTYSDRRFRCNISYQL